MGYFGETSKSPFLPQRPFAWWIFGRKNSYTGKTWFLMLIHIPKQIKKTLIKKRNWQIDFFPWGGIFDLKPLSQCPIQAENFVGMNYMVYWSNSEVRRMFVQGIKSQSEKPENDKNGPKSENFNFFSRNLFAMHKLAIFLLRGHMKLEISHFC